MHARARASTGVRPVVALGVVNLCLFGGVSFADPIWQEWLGAAPYEWTATAISLVFLVAAAAVTLGYGLAAALIVCVHESLLVCVGFVLALSGLLLIGPSPLLTAAMPAWASAPPAWLPYAAAGALSIGVGVGVVSAAPLAVRGCVELGYSRADISAPLSALNVFSGALAACLGYAASGPLVHAVGVGSAATAFGGSLELLGLAAVVVLYAPYLACLRSRRDAADRTGI